LTAVTAGRMLPPSSRKGGNPVTDLLLSWLRRTGIFLGSLVAAGLVMGLVAGMVMVPMGAQLRESGAAPVAAVVVLVLTIVLGGLIYRDIMEREERAG
jgi:hypothetical protein